MVIKKQKTSERTLDRNYHPFPKYLQIRDVILRWLSTQSVGNRLPTEMTLSAQFGVSRETIRKSLQRLEQGGIIRRRPRAGTFLMKRPVASSDLRLTGPIEEFEDFGTATTAKLVRQGPAPAPADVASALAVAEGAQVYEYKRVRFLRGKPLLLLDAYFPLKIGQRIARRDLAGGLIVPALRKMPVSRRCERNISRSMRSWRQVCSPGSCVWRPAPRFCRSSACSSIRPVLPLFSSGKTSGRIDTFTRSNCLKDDDGLTGRAGRSGAGIAAVSAPSVEDSTSFST